MSNDIELKKGRFCCQVTNCFLMNNSVKRLRNVQIFVTNNMREYPPPPKEKKFEWESEGSFCLLRAGEGLRCTFR